MSSESIEALNIRVDAIFSTLMVLNPYPKTELYYKDLFTLLVAVVLSAHTTDKSVNNVTSKLFEKYDTAETFSTLSEEELALMLKTIGLYKIKAKNIIGLSRMLLESYGGKVPGVFDELIKLPGVGRKTANVVLNSWFKMPTVPVDTHVFRVAKRLELSDGATPIVVERDLLNIIPQKYVYEAHHWLVLHGRYICKARNPKCHICPIKEFCPQF